MADHSTLAVVGIVIAAASLLLNVFIVPGGIYLMRAFVREEIKVHDGAEHAHPNLKSTDRLAEKLDDLARNLRMSFDGITSQLASLRLELSEGMAQQSKERREEIAHAIAEHEGREKENNRQILEEAKAIAILERSGKKK